MDSKNCKRKFPRIDIEMMGDFRMLQEEKEKEKEKEPFPGRIKTVGKGGLMLVSPVPLPLDTHLQVRLFEGNRVITFLSKVVWTNPADKNEATGFNVGLQYDPMHQVSLLDIDFLIQTEQSNRQNPSNHNHPP
jgi:hypothetical protein